MNDRKQTMSTAGKLFGYVGQVHASAPALPATTACPVFSCWYALQLAKSYEDLSNRR
jgi:hypothetical protein